MTTISTSKSMLSMVTSPARSVVAGGGACGAEIVPSFSGTTLYDSPFVVTMIVPLISVPYISAPTSERAVIVSSLRDHIYCLSQPCRWQSPALRHPRTVFTILHLLTSFRSTIILHTATKSSSPRFLVTAQGNGQEVFSCRYEHLWYRIYNKTASTPTTGRCYFPPEAS